MKGGGETNWLEGYRKKGEGAFTPRRFITEVSLLQNVSVLVLSSINKFTFVKIGDYHFKRNS